MKRSTWMGLVCGTLLALHPAAPSAAPFLELYGYAYCDGDFLAIGSTIESALRFNTIQPEPALGFAFDQYEATATISGLEVVAAETHGPVHVLHYDGGDLRVAQDPLKNSQWSESPPNATVPATFEDGEQILIGYFTDCTLVYDTTRRVGTLQGHVDFTGGSRLGELVQQTGWLFFGGVTASPLGGLPGGYSLAWDPQLLPQAPVATQRATWGRIKAIYR